MAAASPSTVAAPALAGPPPRASLGRLLLWGALAALLAASWKGAEMRPLELIRSGGNMVTYGRDYFPPAFGEWRYYVSELLVTLEMSLWGTVLAIVCAIPLSLLASSNIAPWWIRQPVRRLLDTLRAINDMVYALLCVTAVGLGPFSGVLALWLSTTGVLGKLFAEAVETIDPSPVEALRATGAHPLNVVLYGMLPQVTPLWVSYALYRFESNVRSASVVGMVGAGGIGQVLWDVVRGFEYAKTSAVLILLIASVVLIDMASSQLRKRLV